MTNYKKIPKLYVNVYTITKLSIQTHTGQNTYKCIQSLSYLCNSHRTENIQVYTINKLGYATQKRQKTYKCIQSLCCLCNSHRTENIQVFTITKLTMQLTQDRKHNWFVYMGREALCQYFKLLSDLSTELLCIYLVGGTF